MVGEDTENVTVTVTLTDKESGVSVSKELHFAVLPLTEEEIQAEKALMDKVIENYFEGIRGTNKTAANIRYDLKPFTEVYEEDGKLVWVRDTASMTGHGIVPTALNNWQTLEAWRLFRSSNPAAITHENLLVTLQSNPKAVKIDSALSSETLGKYGALYKNDPETYAKYAPLADLYYREVSADVVVRGRYTAANETNPQPVEETVSVTFTLKADKTDWLAAVKVEDLRRVQRRWMYSRRFLMKTATPTATAAVTFIRSRIRTARRLKNSPTVNIPVGCIRSTERCRMS